MDLWSGGGYKFNKYTGGVASSLNVAIDSSGNVGIGTTGPTGKLQVQVATNKNVFVSDYATGEPAIGFISTLTAGNYALLGTGNDTIVNRPTSGAIRFRENNA